MSAHELSPGSTSRRAFLAAAVAGAAATTMNGVPAVAAARTKPYKEAARIDVHAHHLAPVYLDALKAAGISAIGGIPIPEWTPELALKFMDAHGIAVQMLSVSDPGVGFVADDAAAVKLAQDVNDYAAGLVAAHPGRFGAFGVVPLQAPAAATAEAVRALDALKLDGVGVLSSARDHYLGDPVFDGLLGELNRRRAWVFVHPTAITQKPAYQIPDFIAEYPFDTTRTIISLLFNDVFGRFPHIRWHFAHGGGVTPMLRFRLTTLAAAAKQFGKVLGLPDAAGVLNDKSVDRALSRSWFDTALIGEPPALTAVERMAGVERMLFGSDWPFAGRIYSDAVKDPQPGLSQTFNAAQRHKIDRRNARAQLPRARKATPSTP